MVPIPNVLAGILIGVANDTWLGVVIVAAIWPSVFCIYVAIVERARRTTTIASFAKHGRHLLLRSPLLTFYLIEFAAALATALPIAILAHGIRRMLS